VSTTAAAIGGEVVQTAASSRSAANSGRAERHQSGGRRGRARPGARRRRAASTPAAAIGGGDVVQTAPSSRAAAAADISAAAPKGSSAATSGAACQADAAARPRPWYAATSRAPRAGPGQLEAVACVRRAGMGHLGGGASLGILIGAHRHGRGVSGHADLRAAQPRTVGVGAGDSQRHAPCSAVGPEPTAVPAHRRRPARVARVDRLFTQ